MEMFKNVYFRLGLVVAISLVSLLAALPRVPIVIKNSFVNIDSFIGGYYFSILNGKVRLDLREVKKGLDLKGGVRIVLRADMSKIPPNDRNAALDAARQIMEKRVNFLGVSEPYITSSKVGDDYRIIVEMPGTTDIAQAVNLIGQTAQLRFRQLKAGNDWSQDKFAQYYQDLGVWEDTNVTGADLKGVDIVFDESGAVSQAPQVRLKFTSDGRKKFSELAKKNVGKPIGLFLDTDESPVSMPVVSAGLSETLIDDPVITGNFDVQTANALSIQIRAGALPVPVEVLEQTAVGATLGEASVVESLFAGVVGLLTVLIFMAYMYGRLGFLADMALVIYILIVLAFFKAIPVVLTLPGIAGFILSVGMAADANILIFERTKEEILWGRPRGVAIKYGFERAWQSIRDSNASSLLTSGVLFYFGSGAVRGFALTLALGIAVSLFTSIFVTKTLISVFGVDKKTLLGVRQ